MLFRLCSHSPSLHNHGILQQDLLAPGPANHHRVHDAILARIEADIAHIVIAPAAATMEGTNRHDDTAHVAPKDAAVVTGGNPLHRLGQSAGRQQRVNRAATNRATGDQLCCCCWTAATRGLLIGVQHGSAALRARIDTFWLRIIRLEHRI